jgi:antitoxin component YwqK of YwqJK toxin-antitoxin module
MVNLRTVLKLRIKRFYFRSGRIHTDTREVGGQFHGPHRTWHRNGRLGQELWYRHGVLHGKSRQWAENGRLLGSFTMENGSGLQRYWYDNGTMQTEISTLAGKFHGRIRSWLRDGTLELWEESFPLGDTGRILTLLSLSSSK